MLFLSIKISKISRKNNIRILINALIIYEYYIRDLKDKIKSSIILNIAIIRVFKTRYKSSIYVV